MNKLLKQKIIDQALTFDDVLLIPQYSDVLPNQVNVKTKLTNKISLNIPIISAAMDTITESEMAIAMALNGGVGVLHKNIELDKQIKMIEQIKQTTVDLNQYPEACLDNNQKLVVGVAIGLENEKLIKAEALIKAGADFLVLDSAHAHTKAILSHAKLIKSKFKDVQLIVGNIATAQAAKDAIKAGADALKVGIGPGSICTTRIVTGIGIPQLTALANVLEVALLENIPVIADGGIKYSGDVTKALALGASSVMLGSMLAGTLETPGDLVEVNNQLFKKYVGMGSLSAMVKGSAERYFQTKTQKLVPEGVEGLVLIKGPVQDVLFQIVGGLKSGMGYVGAADLITLATKSQFVQITNSGQKESHPHSLVEFKKTTNY